jgi:S-DNA-T family DNA segregation ATPase FtsK/SpoIIIE
VHVDEPVVTRREPLMREATMHEPMLHEPDMREQPLVAERRIIAAPTRAEPSFDVNELYPDEQDGADDYADEVFIEPQRTMASVQPLPQQRGAVAPRVAAQAPRPLPGVRAQREAQGNFLDEPGGFELPELSLLAEPRHRGVSPEHAPERLEATARRLEVVLQDFGVKGDIINVRPGPVVTLYELEPAPGIKSSRVISLADDIARSMSAISARVAVVPGRNAIGIELPNENRETVYLREMLASSDFEKMKGKLPICLGKTIGGEPIIADLARMPHLLIAGTTGSGKSVGINTFILSLLYQMTPEQCRLIMIDPKMLELSIYDGIPHLLTPVVTDPSKAVVALKWAVREMEDRYRKMSKIGVRNIDGFNQRVTESKKKGEVITRTVQTGFDKETGEAIFESEQFDLEPLPFIVIIIDEMADLMMVAGKEIEGSVQRLAQMARAAGIHVITATQRPSVDVITGTIKANFPTRISFMVTSKIDSRTILGEQGAEQLLGNGDMLYMAGGGRIRRLHGPFVSDGEVEAVVNHLKAQGAPDYLDSITADEEDFDPESALASAGGGEGGSGDDLYDKAVHVVLTDKKVSTSYIQRRLAIGYNKAATLIERMEKEGVISPANHAGKREILVGNNADGY